MEITDERASQVVQHEIAAQFSGLEAELASLRLRVSALEQARAPAADTINPLQEVTSPPPSPSSPSSVQPAATSWPPAH